MQCACAYGVRRYYLGLTCGRAATGMQALARHPAALARCQDLPGPTLSPQGLDKHLHPPQPFGLGHKYTRFHFKPLLGMPGLNVL